MFLSPKNPRPRPSNHKMPPGLGWVPWHSPMEKLLGFLYNQKVRGWWWNITIPYFWNESTYFLCLRHCFFVVGVWGVFCVFQTWGWFGRCTTTKHHHHQNQPFQTKVRLKDGDLCQLCLQATASQRRRYWQAAESVNHGYHSVSGGGPEFCGVNEVESGGENGGEKHTKYGLFLEQRGWMVDIITYQFYWNEDVFVDHIRAFQKKSRKGWNERLGLTYLHFGQQKTCRSHPGISPCFPGTQK